MSAQITERGGKPEYAVLPHNDYLKLLALTGSALDAEASRAAMRELFSGEDEAIPADVVNRLISGNEHPLKVWREYREFTQEALGNIASVGKSYIRQIEAGSKAGSTKVLKALAETLARGYRRSDGRVSLIMDKHSEPIMGRRAATQAPQATIYPPIRILALILRRLEYKLIART